MQAEPIPTFCKLYTIAKLIGGFYKKSMYTMLLFGSEAYVAVLAYYTYLKGAAKMNVPGAKTVYEDLSTRFPGRPAKKEKAV